MPFIWQWFHLLVKLQAGGTNNKYTEATLKNNYFQRAPCNDCFCLETWSQYHYYNKKIQKFRTILIWRTSRKMNRIRNLLLLYYLWKKHQTAKRPKKVFVFSTLFHSKFYILFFSLTIEINCIKIQTISLPCVLFILT